MKKIEKQIKLKKKMIILMIFLFQIRNYFIRISNETIINIYILGIDMNFKQKNYIDYIELKLKNNNWVNGHNWKYQVVDCQLYDRNYRFIKGSNSSMSENNFQISDYEDYFIFQNKRFTYVKDRLTDTIIFFENHTESSLNLPIIARCLISYKALMNDLKKLSYDNIVAKRNKMTFRVSDSKIKGLYKQEYEYEYDFNSKQFHFKQENSKIIFDGEQIKTFTPNQPFSIIFFNNILHNKNFVDKMNSNILNYLS